MVNYLDTVWNIGEEKMQRDLIYNSVRLWRRLTIYRR